jgi:hypothetical protein
MAQFGAALKDAEEVRSARERLEEVVLNAMVDHAGSMSATETAIWERVRKDRSLMEALIYPCKHRLMSDLLHQVRRDQRPALLDRLRRRGAGLRRRGAGLDRSDRA